MNIRHAGRIPDVVLSLSKYTRNGSRGSSRRTSHLGTRPVARVPSTILYNIQALGQEQDDSRLRVTTGVIEELSRPRFTKCKRDLPNRHQAEGGNVSP